MAVSLFAMGAILGSFLNVIIYRLPRGESIVRPPSACPECGRRITPRDNVPIVSYLILRGRCRHCKAVISSRYPVVELLAGLVPVLLLWRYGLGREALVLCVLSYVLIVVSFIDLDLRIIPDRVTLPGIAVGLILAPYLGLTTFGGSLLGAAVGGGARMLLVLVLAACGAGWIQRRPSR